MLEQEIAFNIQQTDALTRSLSPGAPQQPPPQMFQAKVYSSLSSALSSSSAYNLYIYDVSGCGLFGLRIGLQLLLWMS